MKHVLPLLALLVACGSDYTQADSALDASIPDAATDASTDAAGRADTGTPDGGSDAGALIADASTDTGSDASVRPDSGVVDAGADTSVPDAGPALCTFDTRVLVTYGAKEYESITRKGRYWLFEVGVLKSTGDLTSIARYMLPNGPCAGKAAGTCKLDNVAFSTPLQGNPMVETVTAYGKYWRYDAMAQTELAPIGGASLSATAPYAASACASQPNGDCHLDTGVFVDFQGATYQSFSYLDRFWIFQGNTQIQTDTLSNIPRYAAGPCAGHLGACRFDNKVDVMFEGKPYESIDAYGKYWIFDSTTLAQTASDLLTNVPRYAAGPCSL